SIADAKLAGLWNKEGPWRTYPKRMLKMRARGFTLRDGFADKLKGLKSVEELHDTPFDGVEMERGEQGWEAVAEKTETKKEELKDKLRGKREKVQPPESALPEVVQDPLPGEPTPEGQFIEADDVIM